MNYRKFSFVKYFVQLGADIESTLGTGHSPLYEAILSRSTTIAQYLIDCGADIHTKNRLGQNLFYAITKMRYGDRSTTKVKLLHFLLTLGLDVNQKNESGRTIVYDLVQWNEPKVLACLLDGGADILVKDQHGYSPLHVAAGNGWPEICQLLLENGALLNEPNAYGWTALDVAVMKGSKPVMKFLTTQQAEASNHPSIAFMIALETEQLNEALSLLKNLPDVNVYDYKNLSLLKLCVRANNNLLVKEILSREKIDLSGALSMACARGNVETVRLLLDKGADPNERTMMGTPFYNLFMFGKLEDCRVAIVRLLLDNGAIYDANETDMFGTLGALVAKLESQQLNTLLGID